MAKLSERTGVGISQEIVEPLINTSTSTTTDTTSFSRSDEGVSIVAINSANAIITKRVQSSYATSSIESYRLLVSPGNNVWIDAQARFPFITSATAKYGMRITAVSSTQIDVDFGGDGPSAGETWSSYTSWKWKLLKHRDGRTLNTTTNGIVPIGSVIAIANVAVWSLPAAGQIKDGFALCNGQTVPAGAHPLLTGTLPDLSDERFIQGSTASGTTGGANTKTLTTTELPAHTHTMTHTHGMSHTHTINHDHGSERFWTSGVGNHTHAQYVLANENTGGPYNSRKDYDADFNGMFAYYQLETGANGAHDHYVDVNLSNFAGTSGGSSISDTGAASNSTTSSTGTGSAFDIRPKYFNVVYVMRVL
jgi:hypothetical protein